MKIDTPTFLASVVCTAAILGLALGPLTPPPGPVAPTSPSLADIESALSDRMNGPWEFFAEQGLNDGRRNNRITGSGVLHAIKVNPALHFPFPEDRGNFSANSSGMGAIQVFVDGRLLGEFRDAYQSADEVDGVSGPAGFYEVNVRYENNVDVVIDDEFQIAGISNDMGYTLLYRPDSE